MSAPKLQFFHFSLLGFARLLRFTLFTRSLLAWLLFPSSLLPVLFACRLVGIAWRALPALRRTRCVLLAALAVVILLALADLPMLLALRLLGVSGRLIVSASVLAVQVALVFRVRAYWARAGRAVVAVTALIARLALLAVGPVEALAAFWACCFISAGIFGLAAAHIRALRALKAGLVVALRWAAWLSRRRFAVLLSLVV